MRAPLPKRSAGSAARARVTTSWSQRGARVAGSRLPEATFERTSSALAPSKARRPSRHS